MGAIDSHLSAALGIVKSAQTKIKTQTNSSTNSNRPYVLKDGTVVEDPSDIHLYNMRPAETDDGSKATTGVKDSLFEKNQREYSFDRSYRLDENGNPFNRDDWNQTGVHYEEQRWGETTFDVERDNEPNEPEKSWLNTHASAQANLWENDLEALEHEGSVYSDSWGSDGNKLEVSALGYETDADASLSIGRDGVQAELSANAEAYALKAEYEGTYGPGYLNAEAAVLAEANVTADINFNPLNGDASITAGGEAFAGGKFEAATGLQGDNGKVEANAGVTYGIGIEAKADVGLEDGKVKAEVDLGATLGLGVDVGFEVEVDVMETAKDLTGWIPKTPW